MGTTIDEYPNQGSVKPAASPPFDIPAPDVQFMQAVEETLARADRAQSAILTRLDSIERAILWLAKQPWEREFKDFAELMAAVDVGPAKQQKFREEVVTGPAPIVRDLI